MRSRSNPARHISGRISSAMDQIKCGWFSEKSDLWPGQCMSLEVEQVLFEGKSDYQDIVVLKTKHHGRALILDGIIQCTEHDEFAYQEMISFLPLCAHPNPEKVLIVGGGDGGVAREVTKHPLVKEVIQVEIDDSVVDASKKYLPSMAAGFASSKLSLQICDGFKYMREHRGEFDVIVTDSSDPIGPASNLFTATYFRMLKEALRPRGIVCSQSGTVWTSGGLEHVRETVHNCKEHFPLVKYATVSVPTYPCGQIGFVIACCDKNNKLTQPKIMFTNEDIAAMRLRYYNTQMHSAAFVLPTFVSKALHVN